MPDAQLGIIMRAQDQASQAVKNLGASLGDLAKLAAGIALGNLASSIGGNLMQSAEKAAASIQTLGAETLKLQRETGATAEDASALIAVFGRYGMSVDDASRSLGIFSKHLAGLATEEDGVVAGGKTFNEAMSQLGVQFTDAAGKARPMNQVLLALADKFQQMPDGADKTALALQLFGRSGKDLILTLNQGSVGMQEAMDAAKRYGLTLSGDNVESVRQFGLAHKDVDEAMQGLILTVSKVALPAMTAMAKGAADIAQAFNYSAVPAIKAAGDATGNLTRFVGDNKAIQELLVVAVSAVATGYTLSAVGAGTSALATALHMQALEADTIAIWLQVTAIDAASAAMGVLNGVLAMNPFVLVAMAVAVLSAEFIFGYQSGGQFKRVIDDTWQALQRFGSTISSATRELGSNTNTTKNAALELQRLHDLAEKDTVTVGNFRESLSTLHATTSVAKEKLVAFDDEVRRMTVLVPEAQLKVLQLAQAIGFYHDQATEAAENIMRMTKGSDNVVQQLNDSMQSEHRSLLGIAEGSRTAAGEIGRLDYLTTQLRQSNDVYGQSSAQSQKIMAEMGPLVGSLKAQYGSLNESQKAAAATVISQWQSMQNTITKSEVSAALKDYSEAVKLVREQMTALKDTTAQYGVQSEQAQAIIAKIGPELAALKADFGSLSATQQQEVDNMDAAFQKLMASAQSAKFSLDEIKNAIIAINPATITAAAAISSWQSRIDGVNLALIANQDQLKAAQSQMQGMQNQLSGLNQQLSDAKQRLQDFANPNLKGSGALENQIGTVQAMLDRLDLANKMGVPLAKIMQQYPLLTTASQKYAATLPMTEEGLRGILDQLNATKKVSIDEQLAALQQATKATGPEMTFNQALAGIQDTKGQISGLTAAIASQEGALRSQQDVINSIQRANENLNRTMAEYQKQLQGAQANQQLVNQALQLALGYLFDNRVKFEELGVAGSDAAALMDTKTTALLDAITGAATGTTTLSADALGKMVKDYQLSMAQAIVSVQGDGGNGGLVGTLQKIQPPIDDATSAAEGLRRAIDNLKSKTIEVKTVYTSEYGSIGAGETTPAASVPGFASGGIVPGPIGAPMLAVVHGGETVTPYGGGNVYVTVVVQGSVTAERDLAEKIRRELLYVGGRNSNIFGGLA